MRVQVSIEIDRPVADLWRFVAVEHVSNHPRWDPDMHLEQISEGPIRLGTRIRRRNTRWGATVEGEMEVVEFEPERVIAFAIHDANMDMHGRTTFEAHEPGRTRLSGTVDIQGLDDPAAKELIADRMERSLANMKALIEAET